MHWLTTRFGPLTTALLLGTLLVIAPERQPAAIAQPATTLPVDLAMVPADAAGFACVRAAELWKSDLMAGFRETWAKAGPDATATLDAQFIPKPSTFERAVGFVVMTDGRPTPFAVLTFTDAFVPADVAKLYLPNAKESTVAGKKVYADPKVGVAVHFPDDKHVLIGMAGSMESYLGKPAARTGPLSGAIEIAASGKAIVIAGDLAAVPIPPDALKGLPPEAQPLLKARQIVLSLDLTGDAKLDLSATYPDDAAATDAEKAVQGLAGMARKEIAKAKKEVENQLNSKKPAPRPPVEMPETLMAIYALGSLNQIDEKLANPNLLTRKGKDLSYSITAPKETLALTGVTALSMGLLLPAVQKVREAAARTASMNNLKQICVAFQNYAGANADNIPPAAILGKDKKPLLSWRVAILPFIDQQNLYQQFKLDEPWDSPNNKKLIPLMPKIYASPRLPAPPGMTYYKAPAGPGSAMTAGANLNRFPDGTSNTIAVMECDGPVIWTKPEDYEYADDKPLPKLMLPGMNDGFLVGMWDGSVRMVGKGVSEKTIRAAFTYNGGEILGADW